MNQLHPAIRALLFVVATMVVDELSTSQRKEN